MSKPKILYIGNDLTKQSKYNSAMQTLYELLTSDGYEVIKSSSVKNSIVRLLDMIRSLLKHKNANYVLIDTFSTTAFYYAFITSQIARFFKVKYLPILHGGNLPYRLKKSQRMSKMIFENSYKNIAPSNYLKTTFEKNGFKADYIPNILEIKNYTYKERQHLQPKLLWVRAFRTLYNPTMAIKVVKLLKEKYTDVQLCMIGPFKDNSIDEVKELIQQYKLEKNIEITGVLLKEDWIKKSKEFDIFINTTTIDNTPVSVMEAMALGLPVISTNVGGIPFLIEDKVDGVLVSNDSANNMAKAIINLIETNNTSIAKQARKKVESFGWEEVRKKWLQILK